MSSYHSPRLSLRIYLAPDVFLGPGKADLLQGIVETGSIAAAGRRMNMSYKRAWYLVDTLNGYFDEPLVVSSKGGRAGGGASLTDTGRAVLECYRRVQEKTEAAIKSELKSLARMGANAQK
ncbi:winged helix-turn-helix domain-containing protein [Methylocystis rosea]|uniref:LysR family transcriptional regulator n=1 Tax=Methylocystis rosea TaxID=173366 RepID=A0A3G8MC89_9HYPH|nr:winged helix-turn-helix domain-containing protein [Methylocystis rosea]AZG78820.1 LysR family transcriptional regulator [Methylocystis rosea]